MKKIVFLLLMAILCGCINYQQIHYQKNDLFANKRVQKHIDDYNIYVHQEEEVALLTTPVIKGDKLIGELKAVDKSAVVEHPSGSEELKAHRQDIHVYLEKNADFQVKENIGRSTYVGIQSSDVTTVTAISTDDKQIITLVMLVVGLSILAMIAIVMLFLLLVSIIVNASVEATKAGTDGSGASSDGSDSNSGGSDSGGSDSGASDSGGSGSGCYVATMAYGTYDHPQVLVLRRFRDQYLAQRQWGRTFISWYYEHSPKFVDRTRHFFWLHRSLRSCLNAFILLLKTLKIV